MHLLVLQAVLQRQAPDDLIGHQAGIRGAVEPYAMDGCQVGHHRHQRDELLREGEHRAQGSLIQRVGRDNHIRLPLAQQAAQGAVQHGLQAAFHDRRGRVGIGRFVTELVHIRHLARDAIVIGLAVAQQTRRALVVQHVDNLKSAFTAVRFLQRLGDGVRRATMTEPGVGGEDEDTFGIGHSSYPVGCGIPFS